MSLFKVFKDKKNKSPLESYFSYQDYQVHNIARLSHLDSLNFAFRGKKIIEFGAGIGDHTLYYLFKGGIVTPTDSRKKLIEIIEKRLAIKGIVLDVEKDLNKIETLEGFDFIHCYGLLYHINNPAEFLRSLRQVGKTLLLETCVSSDQLPVGIHLIQEDKHNPTQSYSGTGCRPSRKWIEAELKSNFPYVYYPLTQPVHPEFPTDWTLSPSQNLIRCIFIASHEKLANEKLTSILPLKYEVTK